MNIQQIVYDRLTTNEEIRSLLATSEIDSDKPAIYETWSPNRENMPYVNLTWSFAGDSTDTYQINATLDTDIYADDADPKTTETIHEVIERIILGEMATVPHPDLGTVRFFPSQGGAGNIPEDEPNIVRYNAQYEAIFYNVSVISTLE